MNNKNRYFARILSPSGIYPLETILFLDAVYVADEDLSFSVYRETTHTRGREGDNESYSEVQWLNPSEVRLYGSLLLSIDVELQFISFYPHGFVELINQVDCDLSDRNWLFDSVKPMLIDKLIASDRFGAEGYSKERNKYQRSHIVLPPVVSGEIYAQTKDINYELAKLIYQNIQLNDDLYIRGLYTLIKGGMLRRHYEFLEDAIHNLFISMDVAFNLVRRVLLSQGIKNPSSKDAMTYVLTAFNENNRIKTMEVERWFEEYYDRRIMSFHPDSRYGVVPHAPLYADDFSHLYKDMIEIYRYLICGYIAEK